MIEYNDYRFQNENDLQGFLEKIPQRLASLFEMINTSNGTALSSEKIDNDYKEEFFNHKTINLIENWGLDELAKGTLDNNKALLLMVYVGEVVSYLTGRPWVIDDSKLDIDGDENEAWMLPAIQSDSPEDYSYVPFYRVNFYLKNRKKGELEESIQFQVEFEGKTIYTDFVTSENFNEYKFENDENLIHVEEDEINIANSDIFARKFVDDNLEILQTALRGSGIEINLEQTSEYKYIDKSLFEKPTIEAISEFYLSKLNEVNEHELETLNNIFSAYIVEMFSVKLKGYVDYIPVYLSSDFRLAANTGKNQIGQGAGFIYADETIERIKSKNSASLLSILLKGQMAKRKFMD